MFFNRIEIKKSQAEHSLQPFCTSTTNYQLKQGIARSFSIVEFSLGKLITLAL